MDNKRVLQKTQWLAKRGSRFAGSQLHSQMTRLPLFRSNLFRPSYLFKWLGIWSRKKFELEIACEHRRIILGKRRPEVRCTVVVSQRPGCLRYLPKILCDNINYSRSQWRCSLFHIYRAHQFSAVSRISSRKFSSKRWTWAIIQRHLKTTLDRKCVARLSYPKGPDVCVI